MQQLQGLCGWARRCDRGFSRRAPARQDFVCILCVDTFWNSSRLPLPGKRERCHGDVIVEEFRRTYPVECDRTDNQGPQPNAKVLDYVAKLREESESDDGSSPDEGVPDKCAGYRGIGKPMHVGVVYLQIVLCDGQSLSSPGRWAPASRVYPSTDLWRCVSDGVQRFTDHYGTQELLVSLAMGKVNKCPFPSEAIAGLRTELIGIAAAHDLHLERRPGDRTDVPVDYHFLHVLLQSAEVGLGAYSQGIRLGPGTRMPRLRLVVQRGNGGLHRNRTLWTTFNSQSIRVVCGAGTTHLWLVLRNMY